MNFKKLIVVGALVVSTIACYPSKNRLDNLSINAPVEKLTRKEPNKNKPNRSILDAPNKFKMNEKFMTFGLDMEITDSSGKSYGIVEQRIVSLSTTFELMNSNDEVIARGRKKILSLFNKIEIFDNKGILIGTIEEEIFKNIFSLGTLYTIKDATGKVIGKSRKLDFFTTNVSIKGSGLNIDMNKDFISIGDSWNITINGKVDKRLVAFIPSYISASQKEKKK